jgi:archaellum component FlaC
MNLNEDSIWILISSFLGYEAFNRIQLDIGQAFERLESLVSRVSRLNDMRDYLKSEISSQLNAIRKEIARRTISDLQEIFQKSIERTFSVFEVSL